MKLRPFVVLPILLILLFFSLVLLANALVQKPSVQKAILERLSAMTGYTIGVDDVELYLWEGLGVRVLNFEAHQKDGGRRISASQAIVLVDALPLLKGHIVPKRLHLQRPIIELAPSGEINPRERRIEETLFSLGVLPGLDSLSMDKGSLFIKRFPFRLVNLNAEMKKKDGATLNVKCQGEAKLRWERMPFRLQGAITHGQKKEERPSAALSIETGQMPLTWIPFPEAVSVRNGTCEAHLKIEAKSNEPAKVSGQALIESAQFSIIEKGRTKDYSFKSLSLDFLSLVERDKIHVSSMSLRVPDASFAVNLRLDLQEGETPHLRLEAQSLWMSYSTMEALFPTPLVAPWVERDLLPLLRSGEVLLEALLIDGNLLQLKNLGFPENQDALALRFDCRNFTVHGDTLKEPLKEVSAKVSLKAGVLLLSGLKGVSGKSQIQEGLLEVRDIFRPHPVFEPRVRGSFDLEDILHPCRSDFFPARFKNMVENMEFASGTLEGEARFKFVPSMESRVIRDADFLFRDCVFKHKHWPFSLVLKEGRLKIGEGNGTPSQDKAHGERSWPESRGRFQGSASWGASSFEGEGAFVMKGLDIDPQGLEGVARLDLGQLWSVISPDHRPALFKGSALCRGSITKEAHLWSVKGTADIGSLAVDHESFLVDPPGSAGSVSFDFDFIPEKQIRIKELLWKPGTSQLSLSGDYPFSPEGDIMLQCSAQPLSPDDLGLQLKPGGFVFGGSLKGKIQARIPRKDLLAGALFGEMESENLSFRLTSLPSWVRECNFKALFSGDRVVIPSFAMRTGESSLKGQGELKGWNEFKGSIAVTANPLNLSDFISSGKEGPHKKEPSRFADNTNVRLSLDAQPAQWEKIVAERLTAELLFRREGFHIISSKIQIDRGSLDVFGYVRDDAMGFSSHVEFKDQPMDTLLNRLGIEPLYEGTLTMEAQIYTEGKEWKDLISNLDGGTNVLIEKGVIRKSNVLLTILEFLSVQNIFTKRPPDVSKEGLYFESLGGHGQIEKGVVRTENAQMKSPVLNAVATGSADLGQGLADFDLGVQPLGTMDTVVSSIPILGHILTGENKSLVTYYFEVKGPTLNPQVEHVPFKTLGAGVAGILKRLLLSPVKLFEDISDGIKKLPVPDNGATSPGERPGHSGP